MIYYACKFLLDFSGIIEVYLSLYPEMQIQLEPAKDIVNVVLGWWFETKTSQHGSYLTLDSQQFLHGYATFSLTGYVQENY